MASFSIPYFLNWSREIPVFPPEKSIAGSSSSLSYQNGNCLAASKSSCNVRNTILDWNLIPFTGEKRNYHFSYLHKTRACLQFPED